MNHWDRVFWMLFVLLEVAVILGSVWFFTPIGAILGFVLLAAALARVGDHVQHTKMKGEVTDNKATMKRMSNWLNNQYELTKGIQTLHDNRFHRLDRNSTDLQGDVEKKYRELAGKIIDLENRVNLVSRALLSQSQRQLGKVEKFEYLFDTVWKDITDLAKNKKSISTLSRGVKNNILSVKKDAIVLKSELTKKERTVFKKEIEHFWNILKNRKKMNFLKDVKDPRLVRVGSIIVSILARLPNVEYGIKPRVLYLIDRNTHNLGTLKMHA